jgi:membrane-bound ClpP family serine protease
MLVFVGSVLLAIFVVPAPWGQLVVGGALLWEVAEKLFLLRYSMRMPPAIGREALIGMPVTAVSACLPEGWVKLRGERWKARCSEGAGVGDSLVIEALEQITLIVAQPRGGARGEKL